MDDSEGLGGAMGERLYRSLRRIRRVEEEIARVYPSDKIKSPVHLSIGQEGVSVGVCAALRSDDVVFGTYRSHALYLAKGGDLRRMIAELYGKLPGCGKGKAGSMHLVDVRAGVMGTSAVVGTTIPHAVGYAYALRLRREDRVVAAFFGDGASEEGVFWESVNFAGLKRLPMIFVCENNLYAIHTPLPMRQPPGSIVDRVRPFGVAAERIEDNDVSAIYERTREALPGLREGRSGPIFLECMTYRWREHVGPNEDFDLGYRTREEAKPWIERDPMVRLGAALPSARRARIDAEIEAEIREAFESAEAAPWPPAGELCGDLYGEVEWDAS
ncbi:MAG TPA: thiamine pyrophosphate-dependent dehydrogenase E1 component subunit alpha [Candidatus Binatia bacterium]|nr:thiamine pyrophosphate-dependent dehydrogenase E1 component subunit alpha [Candidatus Binatia bacterium]